MLIKNGTVVVERSYEGIEGTTITVDGGDITVTSSDDGVNVAGDGTSTETADTDMGGGMGGEAANEANQLTINGGTLLVNADGDGLDSNGYATITGGTITVNGPTNPATGHLMSTARSSSPAEPCWLPAVRAWRWLLMHHRPRAGWPRP